MTSREDEMFHDVFGDGEGPKSLGGLITAVIGSKLTGFGTPITGDEVKFHDGQDIILPRDMTYERAQEVLNRIREQQETVTTFDRQYYYRPDDGAYATAQVLKKRYGVTLGEKIDMGPFGGTRPPESRTVATGADQNVQVPWGLISIPSLNNTSVLLCDAHRKREYGRVFCLHAEAPNKYKNEMEELFDEVEQYLKQNSIYRGKALSGADELQFMDLSNVHPEEIVFADELTATLEGTLWAVIRHTEALRKEGIPRKRAILLHGPYGTGKTSIGQLTAKVANENGWTFISARPDDNIKSVLQTGRLYQPAVVFVEDIDTEASTGDDDEVSELLDAFDGITAKGGELILVTTTNQLQRIHKGMLRPGRLDAVIEVASLDRNGVERLIKAIVPAAKLADDVDFDAIHEAMDGFYPAFVREALDRAKTFAINRLNGQANYTLSTTDLVGAAMSLHSQLKALNDASEGEKKPALQEALEDVVTAGAKPAIHGTHFDGYQLSVPSLNGHERCLD